ncbi:MAG: protein-L-isoaspartate(D-aspartate) O-methyltransferase [Magnetovibrio sp.]|nr:protein-L-isoaspartate(D-aspartate) O-methyltransferase [Magnetovibrio sp.]
MNSVPDPTQNHRDALVRQIQTEAAETTFWTGRSQFSNRVMDAMARVPRHVFIPRDEHFSIAYANRPQPIGRGQTISQPYIVALMTDLLDLKGDERILEVGTGSGYQAAVLAEVAYEVYSVERFDDLAAQAQAALTNAGYHQVRIKHGDGAQGWIEYAPFDGIVVTAAVDGPIPHALIEQLAPGGRMVIPLGPQSGPQMLTLGIKDRSNRFRSNPVLPVSFVPLVSPLTAAGVSKLEKP